MPVFNTQGLPVQLVIQPDRNFSDLAAGLQPGQVLRGRVSEVLSDGKAVVNFRGVAVTAELKGVTVARGEVISVSVQDLKGQPVLRLLPQPLAVAAATETVPVQAAAPIDPEIGAVLAQLDLPRDNFHAAVVQLLQGYSVTPSRESVASVKELLASLPAFLEQPVTASPSAPATAPTAPVRLPEPAAAAPIQAAGQPVPAAPAAPRTAVSSAPIAEPPMPEVAVNVALNRGYVLGRLLAALNAEAKAPVQIPGPAGNIPAPAVAVMPTPAPVSGQPVVPPPVLEQPAVPAQPNTPVPAQAQTAGPPPVLAQPTVPAPVPGQLDVPAPVLTQPFMPAPVLTQPNMPASMPTAMPTQPNAPAPILAQPDLPAPVSVPPAIVAPAFMPTPTAGPVLLQAAVPRPVFVQEPVARPEVVRPPVPGAPSTPVLNMALEPAAVRPVNVAAEPPVQADLPVQVPSLPADATAVARVLTEAASLNVPKPLPAILASALQALETAVRGQTEIPSDVRQGLSDLTHDLSALLQDGNRVPVRELGAVAGRLNTLIRAIPGGDTAISAPRAPIMGGVPEPVSAATGAAPGVPAPVRSAAELAGVLAGMIHEEVAQAMQPQVTILASAAASTQVSVEAARVQNPPIRLDAVRAATMGPVRDSETEGARTEAPRSAAPAPVSLPQAVREPDVPVDVPRLMAVVAETTAAMSVPLEAPEAFQAGGAAIQSAVLAPTAAQSQVLSGAVVSVDSRSESLSTALLRGTGALPPPPPPALPVRDPRVGFMPAVPVRDAAGSYGATSAGGPRISPPETVAAVLPSASAAAGSAARGMRSAQAVQSAGTGIPVQVGRDVVETAVFMHAFALPPAREVARAAHEYLFGQAHLNETLQRFEDIAALAGTRSLPAPVREAVQAVLQVVRDVRVTMEGDEMTPSRLQDAVEKLGLGHESKLARAAGPDGEPRPGPQAVAQEMKGVQDSLKAAVIGLRERVETAAQTAQSSPVREALGALRSSADDIMQVVQSQQVGSVSRSPATQVMYVQLPIQVGNEMRGGEVHLSWKKDGEGKNRRRDPRAPATMMLNMETRALGPVSVRMQMTGQNLSLTFHVNDPGIQAFLSGEFGGLKSRLEGFSLKVDRCVAEVARNEAVDDSPRAIAPTSTVDFRA